MAVGIAKFGFIKFDFAYFADNHIDYYTWATKFAFSEQAIANINYYFFKQLLDYNLANFIFDHRRILAHIMLIYFIIYLNDKLFIF